MLILLQKIIINNFLKGEKSYIVAQKCGYFQVYKEGFEDSRIRGSEGSSEKH